MGELLGERITRLRKSRGMNKCVLGVRCGVSNVTIHYWEENSRKPLADNVGPLARALGVTTDYLLTGHETPKLAALHHAIRSNATRDQLLAMLPSEVNTNT